MSVRNLLPPESAKILVLQVKARIVREKVFVSRPTGILSAPLKAFRDGLHRMKCWICSSSSL